MPRLPTIRPLVLTLAAALALSCAAPQLAAVDFGDASSSTLTTKAWGASSGTPEDALAYVDQCIKLYEGEALKMQLALTTAGGRPTNEAREATSSRWALNDVGTCLFIKGNLLLAKGDKAGAKEAYTKLAKAMPDAQCWDTKGWFWAPAAAAKQKLVELALDE
jgi:hypothetical protein